MGRKSRFWSNGKAWIWHRYCYLAPHIFGLGYLLLRYQVVRYGEAYGVSGAWDGGCMVHNRYG